MSSHLDCQWSVPTLQGPHLEQQPSYQPLPQPLGLSRVVLELRCWEGWRGPPHLYRCHQWRPPSHGRGPQHLDSGSPSPRLGPSGYFGVFGGFWGNSRLLPRRCHWPLLRHTTGALQQQHFAFSPPHLGLAGQFHGVLDTPHLDSPQSPPRLCHCPPRASMVWAGPPRWVGSSSWAPCGAFWGRLAPLDGVPESQHLDRACPLPHLYHSPPAESIVPPQPDSWAPLSHLGGGPRLKSGSSFGASEHLDAHLAPLGHCWGDVGGSGIQVPPLEGTRSS